MTKTAIRLLTADNLIRATGPFAILAGLIYAGIQPIHPPDFLASVTTPSWTIFMSLKLAMSLFFIIAITGLYVRQVSRSGWVALAGFVLFGLAWWLETGFIFAELFILPPLAAAAPQFVDSFLGIVNQHPGTMDIGAIVPAYGILGVLYLLGGILLGIGTLRASVLPKGPSVLLAVAALATPAAALLPHEFQRYAAIPVGLAFIWLGFALWFPLKVPGAAAGAPSPAAAR
ncbi:hypothetical protein IC608_10960 [Devosia sp. PTR5]|uniref:DUF4386 family protein n=1 Tax=Devosia oryzisoli TaxID=2774138 RepID=A0A927FWM1_9HYPH|nr:hypothetical protein [Devosia oryzisoli]MBD8065994.1 hypothetical protein [Devosia oryzisoli]